MNEFGLGETIRYIVNDEFDYKCIIVARRKTKGLRGYNYILEFFTKSGKDFLIEKGGKLGFCDIDISEIKEWEFIDRIKFLGPIKLANKETVMLSNTKYCFFPMFDDKIQPLPSSVLYINKL